MQPSRTVVILCCLVIALGVVALVFGLIGYVIPGRQMVELLVAASLAVIGPTTVGLLNYLKITKIHNEIRNKDNNGRPTV